MRALQVTQSLGGRWYGTYGFVRCVAHEDGRPSLRLRDGDSGRLLVKCYAGCEAANILDELRRRKLLDGNATLPPIDFADQIRKEREKAVKRVERAVHIWNYGIAPQLTWAETYLRSRNISCEIPPSIRFHANLLHPTKQVFPALIGRVSDVNDKFVGVHRIFLAKDGCGKAPVEDQKLSLGMLSGGTVRLAPAWDVMAVSEGIESGFSYMQHTGIPTWAALSTAGMQSVILPPIATHVAIVADLDENEAGLHAARKLKKRLVEEGRQVKIILPELDGAGDFNDL